MQKFNLLKQRIDEQLTKHEPINDTSAYDDNSGGGAYGSNEDYAPPTQQTQEQIEQIGLVSLGADIDHLEEQNRAVVKIAEDVSELKEAFTDLNTLVAEQGDMIDHIEQNTEIAKDQIAAGTSHLETAEKNQISARKKQIMILCC